MQNFVSKSDQLELDDNDRLAMMTCKKSLQLKMAPMRIFDTQVKILTTNGKKGREEILYLRHPYRQKARFDRYRKNIFVIFSLSALWTTVYRDRLNFK